MEKTAALLRELREELNVTGEVTVGEQCAVGIDGPLQVTSYHVKINGEISPNESVSVQVPHQPNMQTYMSRVCVLPSVLRVCVLPYLCRVYVLAYISCASVLSYMLCVHVYYHA